MKKNSSWQQTMRRYIIWIITAICFTGIPVTLIYLSTYRYLNSKLENQKEALKVSLQQVANQAIKNIDTETFWCNLLNKKFNLLRKYKIGIKEAAPWLEELRKTYNNQFDYIIWGKKGQFKKITFKSEFSENEWKEVFYEALRASDGSLKWLNPEIHRPPNNTLLRKIIGPQYIFKTISGNVKDSSLVWADSSLKKPALWFYTLEDSSYLLLFKSENIKKTPGVKYFLESEANKRKVNLGIFSPANKTRIWLTKNSEKLKQIEELLEKCETNNQSFKETNNLLIAKQYLTPKIRIFSYAKRNLTPETVKKICLLASAAFLLLMTPFFIHTFRTIVNQQPNEISIRWKLAFLFFFANGIPLLAMGLISQDYYFQKRQTIIKETHRKASNLILSFDNRLLGLHAKIENKQKKFYENWIKNVQNQGYNEKQNQALIKQMKEIKATNFCFIATSSPDIGTPEGIYKGLLDEKKLQKAMSKGFKNISNTNKQEKTYLGMIAKRIMNEINGSATNDKTGITDIGVIGESFLQKSLVEITHSFIKSMGTITEWGFGDEKSMTLVTFLSLPNSKKVDCLDLVIWKHRPLEKYFLDLHLSDANRNPLNLKIIARNVKSDFILPYTFKPSLSLSEFLKRIGNRPNEEIEIIKQNGTDHLAIGFKAKNLTKYQIIGLYDLSHIDRQISRQKNDLMLFCIFSVILAFILAHFLSQAFLFPISSLQETAIAIEDRKFDHQINLNTKDEFGEIAEIFNNVLIGMEELQVAKIVQESLFPEPTFEQNNFKVFGKSITMNELGGDYLDFIKISDNQFSILMGDVAGHGVGAAVIMAMAKAGILSSTSYLTSPLELITRLHQLIYSSKTKKQKKIMTFQYLFIDGNDGEGIYTNAGACSPIYFKKSTGETKEISLPGAALGAFKRAKFKTLDIKFEPGDAMIFYTDGIIEAHNSDGEEIGYEKFSQMVAQSWNENPEVYYQNLYQHYLDHIGEMEPEDDLTIMIAVYNQLP